MIYSTNWIERFNKSVRRTLKIRGDFPNEEAVLALITSTAKEKGEKAYKFTILNLNLNFANGLIKLLKTPAITRHTNVDTTVFFYEPQSNFGLKTNLSLFYLGRYWISVYNFTRKNGISFKGLNFLVRRLIFAA